MPVDFLGVDISKADFHAHLLQAKGSTKRTFPNSVAGYGQLNRWLKNRKASDLHVCMEATGAYWLGLATHLHTRGVRVSVVNPASIKYFARSQMRRTKTDAVDAAIIAEFCKTQGPALWEPPAREILELRAILAYRNHLVSERTRVRHLVSTINEAHIVEQSTDTHVAMLDDLIKGVEEQLHALIDKTPVLSESVHLLEGIPGIAWRSAASIIAELPYEKLRNSKAAAAYAGLCPSDRQSGTSIHGRSRLSKMGNANLRRALYMPALSAMTTSTALARFATRLKLRGKRGKLVVAALMRKMLTIVYAVLKSRRPYVEGTAA